MRKPLPPDGNVFPAHVAPGARRVYGRQSVKQAGAASTDARARAQGKTVFFPPWAAPLLKMTTSKGNMPSKERRYGSQRCVAGNH